MSAFFDYTPQELRILKEADELEAQVHALRERVREQARARVDKKPSFE